MFRFLFRIVLVLVSNIAALYLAASFVDGFILALEPLPLLTVAISLSILHLILKPIVRLLLGPLVLITFGFITFFINAGILYLLDFVSPDVTITTIQSLLVATVLISFVNVTLSFLGRSLGK